MTPAEALAVIDKMVQSIDRMRNMDTGLKSSLIADFDRLSEFVASGVMVGDRLMIKPSGKKFPETEWAEAARHVMEEHKDTLRALADM